MNLRHPILVAIATAALTVSAVALGPSLLTPGAAAPSAKPGLALVGAAKASIEPRPDDYGGTWERDRDACARMDQSVLTELVDNTEEHVDHLATAGSPWPENPNCIYMGGFGIGPANPVTEWDSELGLWVRSVAIGDGTDTLVLTVIDGEGYFADYANKCDDCGIAQLSEELGIELGIDPSGIVIASTHAHSAPDFIGGWGFVPDWYMAQVADTIRDTVRDAVEAMEPAVLEVGEELARPHNSERRDTYRSAEEQQLAWLRAYTPGKKGRGRTIATVGAFAAHPTTTGTNNGIAHPDWPGMFVNSVEDRFGGIGALFMTGLGNMSSSGGTAMGQRLAQLIPQVGSGTRLADTDVRTGRRSWLHPTTNVPLTSLGAAGLFDRQFAATPSSVRTGKRPDTAPCLSASPHSVEVSASAARIGDQFALTTSPGEIFANFSNTVKEKSTALVTMPLGQANDALGYMPQQFEINEAGQQGLGFVAGGVAVVNYEDAYSIDRCFGDAALEEAISLLDDLR
ncbi:MAG: hypothetical protein GEU86_12725 [Actinophytocola sp.]|nr:hypothetical protein [Actinophytocola sp.]